MLVRNRISMLSSRSMRLVQSALEKISVRLGCRVAEGIAERVIFRSLFPMGLTVFDPLDDELLGGVTSASHVSARQEYRLLLEALQLPVDQRIEARRAAQVDAGRDRPASACASTTWPSPPTRLLLAAPSRVRVATSFTNRSTIRAAFSFAKGTHARVLAGAITEDPDVHLDSFTVLISSCAAMVFVGVALFYFWNLDRASKWLLWWSVPFFIGGLGAASYLRPEWEGNFATIGLGNAIRITALCLLWQGARVFERRKPVLWVLGLTPLAWLGLCLIPPFYASMAARVTTVSLFNAVFCGLAAYELWRGRAEGLASKRPAMQTFLSFAALMLARAVTVTILPFPIGALPADPMAMAIFNLVVFVHATFLGFLLIAVTKERREAEQRHFALLDPLTGLMNRRAFMSEVERVGRRRKGGREPMALLVLDLDHFKQVNDRFGHDVGDRVLVAFAGVAGACVRPTDQLHRMGGEEFCFILPDTSLAEAVAVAERIRQAFGGVAVSVGPQQRLRDRQHRHCQHRPRRLRSRGAARRRRCRHV